MKSKKRGGRLPDRVAQGPSKSTLILCGSTLTVSAMLLFLVQLILARHVLPWFGGSASVWITSMVVFQILLLAGYLYAHLLTRASSAGAEMRIHFALVGAAVVEVAAMSIVWPSAILPPSGLLPQNSFSAPVQLILILVLAAGLPFFVLSTTSSLVQHWLAAGGHGGNTYRMFSLSNLGSLAALVCYPLLIEPALSTVDQGVGWSIGFAVFAVLLAGSAYRLRGSCKTREAEATKRDSRQSSGAGGWAFWFVLAAIASALLLATTNLLCQEVTSTPLLWVLPLSLYLLTFVLSFDHPRWYLRPLVLPLSGASITASALAAAAHAYRAEVVLLPTTLFLVCMVAHGEITRSRPDAVRLTAFYLAVTAGGAFGSVLVALIAPAVFSSYVEYPILLGVAAFLVGFCWWKGRERERGGRGLLVAVLAAAGVLGTGVLTAWLVADVRAVVERMWLPGLCAVLVVTAAAGWVVLRRMPALEAISRYLPTGVLAVLCGALLIPLYWSAVPGPGVVLARRGFYGAIRVVRDRQGVLLLQHGQTTHGIQLPPPDDKVPAAYYGPKSTIGIVLREHPYRKLGRPLRVGVVGLGAGALAAYGLPGDSFRFYEIDPDIIDAASGSKAVFTYIRDSRASVVVSQGDARLLMEREAGRPEHQKYDVLVLDAFSGDAIPVHLLTREAFGTYFDLLAPDGIIAVHMSSRHINLEPVLHAVVEEFPVDGRCTYTLERAPFNSSLWMLFSASRPMLEIPGLDEIGQAAPSDSPPIYWTDDYSAIFPILRP